jgi:hypothetical protein
VVVTGGRTGQVGTIVQCWYRETHMVAGVWAAYQIMLSDGTLIYAP